LLNSIDWARREAEYLVRTTSRSNLSASYRCRNRRSMFLLHNAWSKSMMESLRSSTKESPRIAHGTRRPLMKKTPPTNSQLCSARPNTTDIPERGYHRPYEPHLYDRAMTDGQGRRKPGGGFPLSGIVHLFSRACLLASASYFPYSGHNLKVFFLFNHTRI